MNKTLFFVMIFIANFGFSQSRLINHLAQKYNVDLTRNIQDSALEPLYHDAKSASSVDLTNWVKPGDAHILEANNEVIKGIINGTPSQIALKIPFDEEGKSFHMQLVKVNLFDSDFDVVDGFGERQKYKSESGIHYQGILKGDTKSLVAVSIFSDGSISGIISKAGATYVIGKMENSAKHIVYQSEKVIPDLGIKCLLDKKEDQKSEQIDWASVSATPSSGTCKTIGVYFELDYNLYTEKGSSIQDVVSYFSGVFNQVQLLYANDDIEMEVSGIKVWTVSDPYVSFSDTEDLVNAFQANLNGNFPGHIAHFISGRLSTLNGGIAYDIPLQLCTKANQVVVSAISPSYSNFPTYSWTVNVITHEMGHILGSRHTHWCGWSGGPIDGCAGFVEPDSSGNSCSIGPIPSGGGTIMSYCHRVSGVGINFTLGFGSQPGNIIRYKIANAACIASNGVTAVPSSLTFTDLKVNSARLNWGSVSGANYYQIEYKEASSSIWSYAGQSATNSYLLQNLKQNTDYVWRVKTSCSDFSIISNFKTLLYGLSILEPFPFTTLCKNNYVSISYEAFNFLSGNQIYAELSNSSGSFTSPTTIGMVSSSTSGIISLSIPNTVPDGSGYKIRLKSSLPLFYSAESASFTISGASPVNFLSFTASNPSDDSFRIWLSADQTATAYYVVLKTGSSLSIPSSAQIIAGNNGDDLPAILSGSLNVSSVSDIYHKIIGNLISGTDYYIFATLDNSNDCQKPLIAFNISTTGSSIDNDYCIPNLDCTDSDIVDDFIVSGIGLNNLSSGCSVGGYGDFTNIMYAAEKNHTYTFSYGGGGYSEYIRIWIDKDKDGSFESGEIVYTSGNTKYFATTGTFTTPDSYGLFRLRIMVTYSNFTNPCLNSGTWGEAEDYLLDIRDEDCVLVKTLVSPTHDVENGIGKIYNGQEVTAINKIDDSSAADYYGTKSIVLNPGFEAANGAIFKAVIDSNCGNP